LGHSWFAIEVTSDPVPEGPINVGLFRRLPYLVDGGAHVEPVIVGITRELPYGIAASNVVVGVTRTISYSVQEPVAPPPVEEGASGTGQAGFFGPIVGERVEFRFGAQVEGPRLEPIRAEFTSAAHAVKAYERVVPGSASAVREVVFVTPSRREPAYTWSLALQDDEDLLSLLCAI